PGEVLIGFVCCMIRRRPGLVSGAVLLLLLFCIVPRPPPSPTLFPYTTLFRSRPPPSPGFPRRPRVTTRSSIRSSLPGAARVVTRSEEHTSELQSHLNLVCRLLLEKKTNQHR